MKLPKLDDLKVFGQKVLLRADLDVEGGDYRLKALLPTLKYLFERKSKIIIIGHQGRPGGQPVASLSLSSVATKLGEFLGQRIKFVKAATGDLVKEQVEALGTSEAIMLENLRFYPGEKKNEPGFARDLANLAEVYVNEAFATSHRHHASIVGVPALLPHAAGFRFLEEIENLSQVFENPERPLIVVIGGAKKDKLDYLTPFKAFADKILVGGRLPDYLGDDYQDNQVLVAKLIPDKEDLTINSIEKFEAEIKRAKTVVLAGPMGKYEDEGHLMATERVFKAVAASSAFKIAGGRETQKIIDLFGLADRFDWISVGGGAALEYLAKRTLPGIEALLV